jgi:hypothetical protein
MLVQSGTTVPKLMLGTTDILIAVDVPVKPYNADDFA